MIRLIALDLDGTLLPESQQVPPATASLLAKLAAEGIYVVLTSGRCYKAAREVQEMAGITDQPLILHNGAIVRLPGEESVVLGTLSLETTQSLYAFCRKQGWHLAYIFGGGEQVFCNSEDPFMVHIMRRYNLCEPGYAPTFYPIRRLCAEQAPPNKIFMTAENMENGYEIAKQLQTEFSAAEFSVHVAGERFIDITPPGISKGAGLAILMERLGIAADEVLAIGDAENDLSMLELAGIPVAMGNGLEKVKAAAQYITDTNEREGVRLAIEHFLQ